VNETKTRNLGIGSSSADLSDLLACIHINHNKVLARLVSKRSNQPIFREGAALVVLNCLDALRLNVLGVYSDHLTVCFVRQNYNDAFLSQFGVNQSTFIN
jgi:hypothetical protein